MGVIGWEFGGGEEIGFVEDIVLIQGFVLGFEIAEVIEGDGADGDFSVLPADHQMAGLGR